MKKIRIVSMLTALVFIFTLMPINGVAETLVGGEETSAAEMVETVTVNSDFEISEDGRLIRYNGTASEVVIPDGVTVIGADAFCNNTWITSVFVPEGVKIIECDAFHGCTNLWSVILPYGLLEIHGGAFEDCLSLDHINIPETVQCIDDYAFGNCQKLESVVMPESFVMTDTFETDIKWRVFSDCKSLRSINIPEGIKSINHEAFYGCASLTVITLPSTLEIIEESAFNGCPIATVYYRGSETQYNDISIYGENGEENSGNENILNASVIFTENFTFEDLYSIIACGDTVGVAEMLQTQGAKDNLKMLDGVCNFDNLAYIMCNSGCDNIEKLEMAISVQLLNEKNCGKDNFDNYFKNFNECFSNLFTVYSEQSIDIQQLIVDKMQGRELCDLYDAEKNFAHITFLTAFQKSTAYVPARELLLQNADYLEIDMSRFHSLQTSRQNKVIMQLIGYEFEWIDDFKERFYDLCIAYQSRPSGGGSSGGGGGSAIYVPTLTYNAENYTIIANVTNNSENDISFELKLAEGFDAVLGNYESFIAQEAFICPAAENYSYEWHLEEILSGYPSGTYTIFLKQSDEDYISMQFEYAATETSEPEIYYNSSMETYVEAVDGLACTFVRANVENLCELTLNFDFFIIQDGYSLGDGNYVYHHTFTSEPGGSYLYELNVTQQLADYPSGIYNVYLQETSTGNADVYQIAHTSNAEVNYVLSRINATESAEELYEIIRENCDYLGVDIYKLDELKGYKYNMLYELIARRPYEAIESFKANYDKFYEKYKAMMETEENNNQGGSVSGGGGGGSSEDITGPYVELTNVRTLPGKMVTVELMLENNTGFANLGVEIGYDTSVMTLVSAVENEVGVTYQSSPMETVPFVVNWYSNNNCTFNGVLLTLTFEVAESAQSGVYPITVDFDRGESGNYMDGTNVNYDENENSINLSYVHSTLEIIDHIPGDITGDEEVNYHDASRLLKHLLRWDVEVSETALDVNGDGVVDNHDATRLLRWLDGWDVEIY